MSGFGGSPVQRAPSASRPGSGRGGAMVEPAWMTAKRKAEGGAAPAGPPGGGQSPTDRLLSSMQPAPPPPGAQQQGPPPGPQPPSTMKVGEPPNAMAPYMFLAAICSANKWPQDWNLFAGPPGPNGEDMFMWKVSITVGSDVNNFLPKRLLSNKYEAQHDAALHVLKELGLA